MRPSRSRQRLEHSQAIAVALAAFLAIAGVIAFFAAAAVSVPACTTGDAGGITPITGLVVLSETVAEGRGCGTQPGQIYKYTSVVSSAPDAGPSEFVAGGTNDCFSDGTFINLCASSSGSTSYVVQVYAFTETDWNAALADNAQVWLPKTSSEANPLSTAPSICSDPEGGLVPNLTTIDSSLARHASLILFCTATQQANIPVLAACTPAPRDAGGSEPVDAGLGD